MIYHVLEWEDILKMTNPSKLRQKFSTIPVRILTKIRGCCFKRGWMQDQNILELRGKNKAPEHGKRVKMKAGDGERASPSVRMQPQDHCSPLPVALVWDHSGPRAQEQSPGHGRTDVSRGGISIWRARIVYCHMVPAGLVLHLERIPSYSMPWRVKL